MLIYGTGMKDAFEVQSFRIDMLYLKTWAEKLDIVSLLERLIVEAQVL